MVPRLGGNLTRNVVPRPGPLFRSPNRHPTSQQRHSDKQQPDGGEGGRIPGLNLVETYTRPICRLK